MIFEVIKTGLNATKNFTIQHSPEILLGTSIVSGIGATVAGCIATTKMSEINAKHKEIIDVLHAAGEELDGETADGKTLFKENPAYKRNITKEYGRYGLDIAKTWAPCVGLTLLSGTAALGSFRIVNKRLMIAETAFVGVSKAFEQYRDNVIEDQGLEKDEYYANNGALKKKQELIAKGKYKEKVSEKKDDIVIIKDDCIFHYAYNKDTVKWNSYSEFPYYNMRFLSQAQTMFDSQLRENGFVLLDDIYTYLGLDSSTIFAEKAQGRTYGWTLDGYAENGMPNDQHVLFGIYEYNDTQHRLFRAGQINDITLHFNCRLLTKETCELLAKG